MILSEMSTSSEGSKGLERAREEKRSSAARARARSLSARDDDGDEEEEAEVPPPTFDAAKYRIARGKNASSGA